MVRMGVNLVAISDRHTCEDTLLPRLPYSQLNNSGIALRFYNLSQDRLLEDPWIKQKFSPTEKDPHSGT